ncbi:MAG: hypothetical protein ACXWYJ_00545 [Actinomycetota bacterium]
MAVDLHEVMPLLDAVGPQAVPQPRSIRVLERGHRDVEPLERGIGEERAAGGVDRAAGDPQDRKRAPPPWRRDVRHRGGGLGRRADRHDVLRRDPVDGGQQGREIRVAGDDHGGITARPRRAGPDQGDGLGIQREHHGGLHEGLLPCRGSSEVAGHLADMMPQRWRATTGWNPSSGC